MIGACLLIGGACGVQQGARQWDNILALFILSHVTSAVVYTYFNHHMSVTEVHLL